MDTAGRDKKERSLNVSSDLKRALNLAIKECNLSRPQIVDRMNELLQLEGMDEEVSLDVLNSWTKEDPRRIIPTKLIPFFCEATNSIAPISALARALGGLVIRGNEIHMLEIGIAEFEKQRIKQREIMAWISLGINHPFKFEK